MTYLLYDKLRLGLRERYRERDTEREIQRERARERDRERREIFIEINLSDAYQHDIIVNVRYQIKLIILSAIKHDEDKI